jgi:hypothetical protein
MSYGATGCEADVIKDGNAAGLTGEIHANRAF